MALLKPIKQDDGVTTNYHRVLYLMKTTNKQNSIAVLSYVDEEARNNELNFAGHTPYRRSTTYETQYNENMTIEGAYEYLKTLTEFAESEDI